MGYQKLQVGAGRKVVPSDTINIPSITSTQLSSQATGTTSSKLVDTAGNFVAMGIMQGWIVVNTSDGTIATVTAVDDADTLSLSADIMASGEDYVLYSDPEKSGAVLYVGVAGDLKVTLSSGDIVTLVAAAAGFHPVQVIKVHATGTAATDIIAFW